MKEKIMQSKLAEAEGFASSGYNERKRQTDRHNHRQTDRQGESDRVHSCSG